jgi:hypothetical protein
MVTYRDDEVAVDHPLSMVLGRLAPEVVLRLRLEPLSEAAVAELARRFGRPAAGLRALTGGNPLLVTEVLAADDAGVPMTVRDVVLARLALEAQVTLALLQAPRGHPGAADTLPTSSARRSSEGGGSRSTGASWSSGSAGGACRPRRRMISSTIALPGWRRRPRRPRWWQGCRRRRPARRPPRPGARPG